MNIYVSHTRNAQYNFVQELYEPLEASNLAKFIFPHATNKYINSKELFQKHECDLLLAECSYPATGQGIEIGWANILNVPIICAYKTGSDVSTSAKNISQYIIEYKASEELVEKLKNLLIQIQM